MYCAKQQWAWSLHPYCNMMNGYCYPYVRQRVKNGGWKQVEGFSKITHRNARNVIKMAIFLTSKTILLTLLNPDGLWGKLGWKPLLSCRVSASSNVAGHPSFPSERRGIKRQPTGEIKSCCQGSLAPHKSVLLKGGCVWNCQWTHKSSGNHHFLKHQVHSVPSNIIIHTF